MKSRLAGVWESIKDNQVLPPTMADNSKGRHLPIDDGLFRRDADSSRLGRGGSSYHWRRFSSFG